MCTSLIETLHFLFVIVVLPSFLRWWFVLQIIEDFALTKVNIYTSRSQYMYFLLSYFRTSLLDEFIMYFSTFTWNMHFQNWTCVLATTWYIIFLTFHVKDALPKIKHLYFSVTMCTSRSHCLYFLTFTEDFINFATLSEDFVFSNVEPLYFPLTLCTSHSHCVYYQS
jgi:hypothetical protein